MWPAPHTGCWADRKPRPRGPTPPRLGLSPGHALRGWRALTDPQVDVVQEEAAQHLVQRPVHLEPGGRAHQPLQQMLELLGHTLQGWGCHPVTCLGTPDEPGESSPSGAHELGRGGVAGGAHGGKNDDGPRSGTGPHKQRVSQLPSWPPGATGASVAGGPSGLGLGTHGRPQAPCPCPVCQPLPPARRPLPALGDSLCRVWGSEKGTECSL